MKVMCWEDELCTSIVNGSEWDKFVFVKAREKDVAAIEMQDDESLDRSFSCVDR